MTLDNRPFWHSTGIVPVVTIRDADRAVPLARTLAEAGLPIIEITLRTPSALDAIRRIAAEVPEAHVGAGTIRHPADIEAALNAGARFLVSPGATDALVRAAAGCPIPWLPGCATPSEAMRLADHGFATVKFFPASSYGGTRTLRALAAPLAGMEFIPTGGIGPADLADYLSLPSVVAVGGSWMVREDWLDSGDLSSIAEAARAACVRVRDLRTPAPADRPG
ncbi:2-keto-3-deoxy-phosphogluconate aldolase [Tepidamorphus gemmatus]|uniref:2-dehydro-3-deoxy-phosphogluconate aldolase n=1 Tax=Tepidamorphus gemmatus TaxID=747076 RepID=A0A4R3MBY1_9HYPH|nr:bifunctional 4-hydroxy-2-oxoglutarate aldolase/2-dehydro-3-deoxy-phosphogluconate aldolase [Tepidamorphus gemmatus]TCT10642.1 2-keto-3-deoxy-phosphogluconate aldolase [Tepidamorphus gemmatus]